MTGITAEVHSQYSYRSRILYKDGQPEMNDASSLYTISVEANIEKQVT